MVAEQQGQIAVTDPVRQARLHYIDWLRVLAVLLLFPFHTSRVFDTGDPFYIKSQHLWEPLSNVLWFISVWHMQLLFLLAGASTYFALGKRSTGQYALERVKRLFVPLVFGILVLMPPQTWVGGQFNSGYSGSYWHYITSGDFLVMNIQDTGDYYGGFGVGHLWFILFLFLLSLIALPLFAWGRTDKGARRMRAVSQRLAHPAWWLLPPLVIMLAEGLPAIAGKNLVYYLVFFLLGYVVVAGSRFAQMAQRYRWPTLIAGIGLSLWWVLSGDLRDSLADPSFALAGLNYLGMLATWSMLTAFWGLGRRYLDHPGRSLSYLSEASYPLYLLHQTVIVVLAFSLVGLAVPGPVQWIAVFVASVVVTFGLYEVVRRVAPLRFLFGMRPRWGSGVRREEEDSRERSAETPSDGLPLTG